MSKQHKTEKQAAGPEERRPRTGTPPESGLESVREAASTTGGAADGGSGPAAEGARGEPAGDRDADADRAAGRIAELEAEVSSLKDQYLRKLADYENFRKRMFRDKEDAVQFANSQILADLVGVLDDFDRAIQSTETSRDFQALHGGVDMIRKRLLALLEGKYGLARFDSVGIAFDPNLHEAVLSEQGECGEPVVVEEYARGYKLRDRVLRSAKVKVRMPVPGGAAAEAAQGKA